MTEANLPAKAILYVENNPDDALLLSIEFKKTNVPLPVRVVPDGAQAQAYLRGTLPYIDREEYPFPSLLILDLGLNGLSGLELLSWIRNTPPYTGLSVVVLTASLNPADKERATSLGISGFYDKTELLSLVHFLAK
jgi:CheY-like chemotaxis protein